MAKKKLSGHQGRVQHARRQLYENSSSPLLRLIRFPKRGRPKGETKRHQELQNQIYRDLAQLGLPYGPNLYTYLTKNLPDPKFRAQYQLAVADFDAGHFRETDECPQAYKIIGERHFRREIASVHRKIRGWHENRSLGQRWWQAHTVQEQARAKSKFRQSVRGRGGCSKCFRKGVYVGPCYCLMRQTATK
jgi:hypothetical protein